jgi:hypothetical protein
MRRLSPEATVRPFEAPLRDEFRGALRARRCSARRHSNYVVNQTIPGIPSRPSAPAVPVQATHRERDNDIDAGRNIDDDGRLAVSMTGSGSGWGSY